MDAAAQPGVITAAPATAEAAHEAGHATGVKIADAPKGERKGPGRQEKLRVFSGTANPALAKEVCDFLGLPLGQTDLTQFSDGEIYVQILENVRGADVFVIQPTCDPVSQNLMQLLLIIDALKRASARRITVVIPYFGYARQDRKDKPRVPISSKLVADMVISPDAGGVERARFFAKKMDAPMAIVDKRRTEKNVAEVMNVIGDVRGRTCLVLDDIVDTAGTLVKTAQALLDNGAVAVYACASHAVLSGPALERISQSNLKELVVTNTIPLSESGQKEPKIKVLSIAGLIGRAIQSIHEETSISRLFT